MEINLGFEKSYLPLNVPEQNMGEIIRSGKFENRLNEKDIIANALDNPIHSYRIEEAVKQGEKIVIISSDITRPMPTYKVLPAILERLNKAGVSDKDITLVFGLGSHRKHTHEEQIRLAGAEAFNRINCIDSDPENVASLGITSNGTPVDIFRPVTEADRIIALGNIEYHYFAGYSGGYKAIMPGVSTFTAIQKNHSLMVKPGAQAGTLTGNPVRDDIEEVAKFVKIDFLFNVVLDENKNIIGVFAGEPMASHRQGCLFLDSIYMYTLKEKADIVVVCPGGFPKDINLYQAQKALDNAKYAVKEGGIIILIAACTEGLGGESFEEWMIKYNHSEEMIEEIQRNFILGGHKAAAIALILKISSIYLVSRMDPDFVRNIFMIPFVDPQTALETAIKEQGPLARVHIMPYGGSTLPGMPA